MGIKIPFHRPREGAYQSHRVDVALNARQQKAAAFLVAGLAGNGERAKHKIVNSPALAVLWMFDRVADALDSAEANHKPVLDKYAEDCVEWQSQCDKILEEAASAGRELEEDNIPDPELPENPES